MYIIMSVIGYNHLIMWQQNFEGFALFKSQNSWHLNTEIKTYYNGWLWTVKFVLSCKDDTN